MWEQWSNLLTRNCPDQEKCRGAWFKFEMIQISIEYCTTKVSYFGCFSLNDAVDDNKDWHF